MKRETPKSWQEAGMETKDAELARIFTADSWIVPNVVEREGKKLLWRATAGEEKRVHPGRELIEDFIRLHDASLDQIVKYAKRWGALGLCSHGLPANHSYPSFVSKVEDLPYICEPVPAKQRSGYSEEPLEKWCAFSKQAYGLLNIAARLHKNELVEPKDWEFIFPVFAVPSAIGSRAEALQSERHRVAYVVQRWLSLGAVRPRFTWEGLTPTFELGGPTVKGTGLFGALAVQLLLIISRIDGLALCSGCAIPYIPPKRPQAGRRNYCLECQNNGIPMRHAMRDRRAREKDKPKHRKKHRKSR
jgi:hypothetical protein